MTQPNLVKVRDIASAAEVFENIRAVRERLQRGAHMAATEERKRATQERIDRLAKMAAPGKVILEPESDAARLDRAINRAIEKHNARDVIEVASVDQPAPYLRQLCRERGITVDDVLRDDRRPPAVALRLELIVAVHKRFPHAGLTDLGRLFRRDHTSIIHCLVKAGLRPKRMRPLKEQEGT